MKNVSAGILAWRLRSGVVQVLLVHPGGPFFHRKDAGVWSIPKGLLEDGEDALAAARREFAEELGVEITGQFIPLSPVRQKGGKVVHAFCVQADVDTSQLRFGTFSMEWPPRSGAMKEFPEVDRAEWLDAVVAKEKINPAQAAFIDELTAILNSK